MGIKGVKSYKKTGKCHKMNHFYLLTITTITTTKKTVWNIKKLNIFKMKSLLLNQTLKIAYTNVGDKFF